MKKLLSVLFVLALLCVAPAALASDISFPPIPPSAAEIPAPFPSAEDSQVIALCEPMGLFKWMEDLGNGVYRIHFNRELSKIVMGDYKTNEQILCRLRNVGIYRKADNVQLDSENSASPTDFVKEEGGCYIDIALTKDAIMDAINNPSEEISVFITLQHSYRRIGAGNSGILDSIDANDGTLISRTVDYSVLVDSAASKWDSFKWEYREKNGQLIPILYTHYDSMRQSKITAEYDSNTIKLNKVTLEVTRDIAISESMLIRSYTAVYDVEGLESADYFIIEKLSDDNGRSYKVKWDSARQTWTEDAESYSSYLPDVLADPGKIDLGVTF